MTSHPARMLAAGALTVTLVTVLGTGTRPAAAAARPAAGPQALALQPQTRADLMHSMHGEAYASAAYTFYAAQAQRQLLPDVARLFTSTARVELRDHFAQEAVLAGLAGDNAANLRNAIAGETRESRFMYPGFARQAARAGERAAAALFTEIARDEAGHAAAFQAALDAITSGRGGIPAPPAVSPVPVPPGPPKVTARPTLANLATAMHGEAFASAKYTSFAARARAGGDAALARLLAATAAVELREHFAGEAVLAGLVGTTRANLTTAIAGERHESRIMYPEFARRAAAAGDAAAAALFRHNAADEAAHARAFQQALDRLGPARP